jgi:hypothetical protein
MDEMAVPATVLDEHDRRLLLEHAATLLDERGAHLGAGDETPSTPEGEIARIFATDRATLGRPVVHRIAASQIGAERRDATLTDAQLERRHRHYWLALPVSLWTRPGCAFNQLQVKVNFNPSDDEALRPTAFDALPDQQLVTLFEASAQLELGVGADFHITAKLPDVAGALAGLPLDAGGGVESNLDGRARVVARPFEYSVRAAKVTRSAVGLDHIMWRLEESAFADENDPGLRIVVRVPDGVDRLEVSAQMVATRYVSLFSAGLRQSLRDLPAKLREFFADGTPIAHAATWDLTEEL